VGRYRIGEIAGAYYYQPGDVLPHRRPVRWLETVIDRLDMSDALKNSTGSIGTVSNVTGHAEEIERLISGGSKPPIPADEVVEDFAAFAMERHLEEFLIENWDQTTLGKDYDIYEVDGERVGQQYPTGTGPLDILAISKDRKTLLVVELKKGRASDAVVGQTLRYMGYVLEELAEPSQVVRGVIIALQDDQRIRRALGMMPAIEFLKYEITLRLVRA
jgi:restriction system protein